MQYDIELQKNTLELKFELGSYLAISGVLGGSPALWWKSGEKGLASPLARKLSGLNDTRYRVQLDFQTEEERKRFYKLLKELGNNRKEQSKKLLEMLTLKFSNSRKF